MRGIAAELPCRILPFCRKFDLSRIGKQMPNRHVSTAWRASRRWQFTFLPALCKNCWQPIQIYNWWPYQRQQPLEECRGSTSGHNSIWISCKNDPGCKFQKPFCWEKIRGMTWCSKSCVGCVGHYSKRKDFPCESAFILAEAGYEQRISPLTKSLCNRFPKPFAKHLPGLEGILSGATASVVINERSSEIRCECANAVMWMYYLLRNHQLVTLCNQSLWT